MLIRKRDIVAKAAPAAAPEKVPDLPSEARTTDTVVSERLEQMERRIEQMLANLKIESPAAAEPDPRIQELIQVVSDLQAARTGPKTSEWVFDVERGPYNEIKQVNARRRSTLERAH